LDGGQGKIEECNGEPRTNVTDPKAPQDTRSTIAGGNNILSAPFASTNQRNEIELQGSLPELISTPLVAKPDRNTYNMKNWKKREGLETSGVEYKSPPASALCGQSTKSLMGCTYASNQDPDDNITALDNDCTNTITTMDGLKQPFLMHLGKEATGSLQNKLRQQNKQLRMLRQKLQINTY
jgi:hypothetical protein